MEQLKANNTFKNARMSVSSNPYILKKKKHLGDEADSDYSFSDPVPANNFSKALFKKDKKAGKSFPYRPHNI